MKKIYLLTALLLCSSCAATQVTNSPDRAESNNPASMIEAEEAFNAGNYKKSAKIYKANIKNTKESRFLYAESLRLLGDSENAIKQYDHVLNKNAESLLALEGKSLAYVQLGEFKKAAKLLSKVVNEDAARWRTINALGVIYATTGYLDEAQKYYNIALDISNNNPSVLNNMGLSAAFSGDIEQGKQFINSALNELNADDEYKRKQIEYNLALIYGISGQMDESQAILSKYLNESQVMNNLGFYARLANDNALAKTYLSKALSASPVYYEKAWDNLTATQ